MKRSFWIILLALVVLIGGAWALYSRLGAQMNVPQLNAQPAKEAEVVEEAAEIEPAEEAEEPKEPDESEEEAPQE